MKITNSNTTAAFPDNTNSIGFFLDSFLYVHRAYRDLKGQRKSLLRRLANTLVVGEGSKSYKRLLRRIDEIDEVLEFLRGEHEVGKAPVLAA